MQNFIAQSMRRAGLAPSNKVTPTSPSGGNATSITNDPMGHMNIEGKYSYTTLSYPSDLQSRSDLGHYIMFYVNIPTTSEYGTTSSMEKSSVTGNHSNSQSALTNPAQNAILRGKGHSAGDGAGEYNTNGRSWKPGQTDRVMPQRKHKGNLPRLTKRTNDAITLYMPNTGITSQHTPQWSASEMGNSVGEAASRVTQGGGMTWGNAQGFAGQVAKKLKDGMTAMGSTLAGGDIKATVNKLQNQAENNFLEMFFKGIDMRKFDFTWNFRPRNPKEVEEVNKIVQTFKFHSLPEFPDNNAHGRYFTPPATWDIFYMYRGDENKWINKIAECVCGAVNINYSPTEWQTFRPIEGKSGAPPTEIDMTLSFMETRIITKEDVLEGF
jgi:hypothetical protein